MPVSHVVSRVALLALVVAIVTVLLLTNVDAMSWRELGAQLREMWSGLRGAIEGEGTAAARR